MRLQTLAATVAMFLTLGSTPALFAGEAPCTDPLCDPSIPQQAILRLEPGFTIEQINTDYGTTLLGVATVGSDPRYLLDVPPPQSAEDFIAIVDEDFRVKKAELNFQIGDPDPGTQSFFFAGTLGDYWNQPARIQLNLNRETGAPPAPGGTTITVAVIDTGVDANHPMLAGRVRADGLSLLPGDPGTGDLGNNIDDDGDGVADELVGHGTFVSGLILMAAPEAEILPIRIFDSDGTSNMFRLAQAIAFAIDRGVDVINLSLGSTSDIDPVEDAILDAIALGIPVIASVGNDGVQTPVRFPAAYPGAIAVGAVTGTQVASFSNVGSHVTVMAPGVSVGSTIPGAAYGQADGTSYAAPLVTGLVARIRAADPSLTPLEIKQILQTTAESLDAENPGLAGLIGAGLVNARAALAMVNAAAPLIEGDVNGDHACNFSDLNLVLESWDEATSSGDANASGFVDFEDLNAVLFNFGIQD